VLVLTCLAHRASAQTNDCSAAPTGPFDISPLAAQNQFCLAPTDGTISANRAQLVTLLDGARQMGIAPDEVWRQSSTTATKGIASFIELSNELDGFTFTHNRPELVAYLSAIAKLSSGLFGSITFQQVPQPSLGLWIYMAQEQLKLGNDATAHHMEGGLDAAGVFATEQQHSRNPYDLIAFIGEALRDPDPVVLGLAPFFDELVFSVGMPTLQLIPVVPAPVAIDQEEFAFRMSTTISYFQAVNTDTSKVITLVDLLIDGASTYGHDDPSPLLNARIVARAVPNLDDVHVTTVENWLGDIRVPGFDRNWLRELVAAMESRIGLTPKLIHAAQIAGAAP
jgi:hypothetical protein